MKVSKLIPNPNNPRVIKDHRFEKLCKSLQEFPKMMELRPIVVDDSMTILGGNMRLRAIQHLGMKDIPDGWVKKASDLTEDEKQRFIIADNVGFGDWDWEIIANEWDSEKVAEWGLDVPLFMDEPTEDDLIGEENNRPATMKITFESPEQLQKAEVDIQELLDRKYPGSYFSVSAGEI